MVNRNPEEARLMQNSEGVQKGQQDHAEGQHGSKTHSKFLEQLQSGNGSPDSNGQNGADSSKNPSHTTHRLVESRQQHDAAEKRSEKTRLNRAIERHELGPGTD
jgi:hypothetical protein